MSASYDQLGIGYAGRRVPDTRLEQQVHAAAVHRAAHAEAALRDVDVGVAVIDEGTGEVGLPGFPHPDSLIAITLFDTEGEPLEGTEIWFAAQGYLSTYVDTTDADGRIETGISRVENVDFEIDLQSGGYL